MQQQMSFLDSLFGKTCPEPSQATKEKTSKQCSRRSATSAKKDGFLFLNLRDVNGSLLGASWEITGALPGVSMTLNFGESPSEERESTLSQILQESAPEKYSLSQKACAGILRRAQKRGKELPDMLREALEEVAGPAGLLSDDDDSDRAKAFDVNVDENGAVYISGVNDLTKFPETDE